MATSEIHAVRSTPERLIAYIMKDKCQRIQSEDEVHKDCQYDIYNVGSRLYVRYRTINAFQNCPVGSPAMMFDILRQKYQKASGRARAKDGNEPLAWHGRVSFSGRECSPETASQIGQKIAEEVFKGFPVVVSTHTNGDNIHCHFAVSAWDLRGKKWNNCHATTQLLRDTTDRVCREYGLSVLQETSKMKLVKYKDTDGQTRYWEPTERKRENAKMRDEGVNYPDDVNSYRNTKQFSEWKEDRRNHVDIVKRDIDSLLPYCSSYDDLLDKLRAMGYTIRAKKKDGTWLAHVSFKAPQFEKAVREDRVGDGKFYLRENLTAYILKHRSHGELGDHSQPDENDVPFFSGYRYSRMDLSAIRDDFYKTRNADGVDVVKPRSDWQRKAIRYVRAEDYKVRQLLDTTELRKLAEEQESLSDRKQKMRDDTEAARSVAKIVGTFRALQSAEKNDFRSYGQMLDTYKSIRSTYMDILKKRKQVAKLIDDRKFAADLPQHIASLEEKMQRKKGDVEYLVEHYQDDLHLLRRMQDKYQSLGIGTSEQLEVFRAATEQYEARLMMIDTALADAEARLDDVDNCIRSYARIDSDHGIDVSAVVRRFELLTHGDDVSDDAEDRTERRDEKEW